MVGYSLEDENLTKEIIEEYEEILDSTEKNSTIYHLQQEIITIIRDNKFIVYVYDFYMQLKELYIYDNIFELARDWREAWYERFWRI